MHWLLVVAIALVLVGAGFWTGLRVAGPTVTETELGKVSLEIRPSAPGGLVAFLPVADWGLQINAFRSIFEVYGELRTIDRNALIGAASGSPALLESTEAQLTSAARWAVIRSLIVCLLTIAVFLLVATLLWRGLEPRWMLGAIGGGLTLLVVAGAALAATTSFDRDAFRTPAYFASGNEIEGILNAAEDPRVRTRYGAEFTSILRGIGAILAQDDLPDGDIESREIFVASDFHGNALVVDPVSQMVGDSPLLLVGDYGQRSLGVEVGFIGPRVAALGSRSYAVSGNHDSAMMMRRLANEGVTVISQDGVLGVDGRYGGDPVIEVEGLTLAGYRDPLEWQELVDSPDRKMTYNDFDDTDAARAEELVRVIEWFEGFPEPKPNMVMIHQNELAEGLATHLMNNGYDSELVVITGHNHRQQVDRFGRVVMVNTGSVGASGVFGVGRDYVGLGKLDFSPNVPSLRSIDLLSIEPLSGQAQATRIPVSTLCPEEQRCTVTPTRPVPAVPAETDFPDGD